MRPIEGRHVLFGLLGFFGIMLAANSVFVYFATTTFSGLSEENAYRKGVQYNDTIAAFRSQQALGWGHAVALAADGQVTVRFTDAAGEPVSGLSLSGTLGRPAMRDADRVLTFLPVRPGLYAAEIGPLAPGQWQVQAVAVGPPSPEKGAEYRLSERLLVAD